MTTLSKKIFRPFVAALALGSLLTFSACANDDQGASYSSKSAAPDAKTSVSKDAPQASTGKVPAPGTVRKPRKKSIDWKAVVQDPIQYLLTSSGFPKPYKARTLSLSERGQAIQDVGRAGISVSNLPSSCNGAGGRIGEADDQLAMQMGAQGNKSLTLVVVNTEDPYQAVADWKSKNDSCSAFLSTENGVTSKVTITPVEVNPAHGEGIVGYKIVTYTANIRGSMRQEQILYAVPREDVVIEVMAMSFNQEVNPDEAEELLKRAVERAHKLEKHELPANQLIKDAPSK